MHPQDEKVALRASIKDRIGKLPTRQLDAEGRSISRRILESLSEDMRVICAFVPLKDEADITLLLRELLERRYEVYLPRYENQALTFAKIEDLATLKPGALNISEPPDGAPELDPKKADLVLIPGRAFDRTGVRLGRGNGGYDKWISKQRKINPKTQYWGVALESQVVNELPVEAHDERMDAVVTARGKIF